MEKFKVICKTNGNDWVVDFGIKKIVTKKFFGLIKTTTYGEDKEKSFGPSKEEICIVLDVRYNGDYKIAGYTQYGWYCPDPFIRLDEFTETQKEIARKSEPALN